MNTKADKEKSIGQMVAEALRDLPTSDEINSAAKVCERLAAHLACSPPNLQAAKQIQDTVVILRAYLPVCEMFENHRAVARIEP